MDIAEGIAMVDLALYMKRSRVLVVSDFHIGYEEQLIKQGVIVPKIQFKDTIARLQGILAKVKPKTIVINGDVKDEFGKISEQEWRETLKLIDFLAKHCQKLYLIKGNHDTILGPIAKKRNIEVKDYHIAGGILMTHGDVVPEEVLEKNKNIKTIIIGHEHPAVHVREGERVEKFKCFLKAKFRGKTLLVLPSFNLVIEGTDIISEETPLSPFLHQDRGKFHCYVVGDKIYDFGLLKNLVLRI